MTSLTFFSPAMLLLLTLNMAYSLRSNQQNPANFYSRTLLQLNTHITLLQCKNHLDLEE